MGPESGRPEHTSTEGPTMHPVETIFRVAIPTPNAEQRAAFERLLADPEISGATEITPGSIPVGDVRFAGVFALSENWLWAASAEGPAGRLALQDVLAVDALSPDGQDPIHLEFECRGGDLLQAVVPAAFCERLLEMLHRRAMAATGAETPADPPAWIDDPLPVPGAPGAAPAGLATDAPPAGFAVPSDPFAAVSGRSGAAAPPPPWLPEEPITTESRRAGESRRTPESRRTTAADVPAADVPPDDVPPDDVPAADVPVADLSPDDVPAAESSAEFDPSQITGREGDLFADGAWDDHGEDVIDESAYRAAGHDYTGIDADFGEADDSRFGRISRAFFGTDDQPGEPSAQHPVVGGWPEPVTGASYTGGHPMHPKRRKNVTVAFGETGVLVTADGLSPWKLEMPWAEVDGIDVQSPDELRFRTGARIDQNSSALVLAPSIGGELVFEVRMRRPAALRSALASVLGEIDRPVG